MRLLALFLSLYSFADEPSALRPHMNEPAPASATLDEDIRTVAVGTVDVLSFDFVPGKQPLIGNASVLDVSPGMSDRELRVVPLKKGTSSLIVFDAAGTRRKSIIYNVITNDLSRKVIELRQLLAEAKGLRVNSVSDHIVVDGKIASSHEASRLAKLEKAYPEMLNLAEGSDEACAVCAKSCGKKKR